jgi:hypothetical protein
MSGALNSVFGGGNIFGALMSIASIAFPPMAIANSLSNLLLQGIGQAVSQAVGTLVAESGMPKFLGNMITNFVDNLLGGQRKETNPAADAAVSNSSDVSNWMEKFVNELSNSIIENTRKKLDKDSEGSTGGAGKKGAPVAVGSWLQAIAVAMGEIAGDKAAQMVELRKNMSDLNGTGKDLTAQLEGAGKDDEKARGDIQAKQADNAREFAVVQSQFQATSQEFSILQNTFANAIKSIGEGLTAMGRKG